MIRNKLLLHCLYSAKTKKDAHNPTFAEKMKIIK